MFHGRAFHHDVYAKLFWSILFFAPCRERASIFFYCFWLFDAKLFRARKLKAEGLWRLGDKTGEILEGTCIPPHFYPDTHIEKEKRRLFLAREGI